MKLKEMFKMVNQYNEVAGMIGKENVVVRMELDNDYRYQDFKTLNELKNWFKEEVVDELTTKILDYDRYENGKEIELEWGCRYLDNQPYKAKVRFWLV